MSTTQQKPVEKAETEKPKRFAVYDLDHGRFVGPVVAKKPTEKEAKDLVGGHEFEIREV